MDWLPVTAERLQYGAALVGGKDSGEGAVLPHFGRLGSVGHEEREDLIRSGSQGGAPQPQPVGGHRPGVNGAEAVEVLLGLPENQIGLSHEPARDRSVQPAGLLLLPRQRAARKGQHVSSPHVPVRPAPAYDREPAGVTQVHDVLAGATEQDGRLANAPGPHCRFMVSEASG
jgi:hypothetical protein